MLIPNKPTQGKFLFKNLTSTQYREYAKQYSTAKAVGIRSVYAWASGTEVIGIISNIGKGVIIDYSKRKVAALCMNAAVYIASPAVVVFTNSSNIVNISRRVHSIAAFCFECVEDSTNLSFLPIDIALFGQPIPIGSRDRFNLLNHTDFLDG